MARPPPPPGAPPPRPRATPPPRPPRPPRRPPRPRPRLRLRPRPPPPPRPPAPRPPPPRLPPRRRPRRRPPPPRRPPARRRRRPARRRVLDEEALRRSGRDRADERRELERAIRRVERRRRELEAVRLLGDVAQRDLGARGVALGGRRHVEEGRRELEEGGDAAADALERVHLVERGAALEREPVARRRRRREDEAAVERLAGQNGAQRVAGLHIDLLGQRDEPKALRQLRVVPNLQRDRPRRRERARTKIDGGELAKLGGAAGVALALEAELAGGEPHLEEEDDGEELVGDEDADGDADQRGVALFHVLGASLEQLGRRPQLELHREARARLHEPHRRRELEVALELGRRLELHLQRRL